MNDQVERPVLSKREYAEAVLKYEDLLREINQLESEIKQAALYYEQSIELSGVQVKYSEGRRSYDWQGYLSEMIETFDPAEYAEKLEKNTKIPPQPAPRVSWASFGKDMGAKPSDLVEAGFSTQSEPTVKIQVREK